MVADSSSRIETLRVDGGAAANNFLMQFQAYISNTVVFRPSNQEATAAGAAFLAGLAAGFYKDRDELLSLCQNGVEFKPSMDKEKREELLCGWHKAVKAAQVK